MELIFKVKENTLSFLDKLYKGKGYFSYSLNSDLYDQGKKWGLANTVFATKIYYILNSLDNLDKKPEMVDFIQTFSGKGGIYFDPLLWTPLKKFRSHAAALKKGDFSNLIFKNKNKKPETRQAIVALWLLGDKPKEPFVALPYTIKSLKLYLLGIKYHNIWGAASYVNHLLFFYKMNADLFDYKTEQAQVLKDYCLKTIDDWQNPQDGLWYRGEVSVKQKINGAMKIISAFNIIGRKNIDYAEKIIDFMLAVKDDYYYDGCDNLNAMYVLRYVFDSLGKNYRCQEVNEFCRAALSRYEKYFYPQEKGFSFIPGSKPRKYYGREVTKSFPGADLHGTMMFTWATALIADITGVGQEQFKADIIN